MKKKSEELTNQELLEKLTKMVKKKQQALEAGLFALVSLTILGFLFWNFLYLIMKWTQKQGAYKATWIIIAIIAIILGWFIWLYLLVIKYKSIVKKQRKCERINTFINNHHE